MFERFLKKNLNLKILSLTLASLLWLLVHLTQISEGIARNEISIKIPLVVENLAADLHVLEMPSHVFVSVKPTAHKTIEGLKPSDFKASVDLDGKKAGAFRDLPVHVASPVGYVVTEVRPAKVEVVVDEESEKTVPITWTTEGGKSTVGKVIITPPEVVIKGSQSQAGRVIAAQVRLREGVNPTQREDLEPIPVDALGRPILGLSIIPQKVSVMVERSENVKTLPVRPVVVGKMAAGTELQSVSVMPGAVVVDVAGQGTRLDHLDTAPIDITGRGGTVVEKTRLVLPPGVKLRGKNEVSVTLEFGKRE